MKKCFTVLGLAALTALYGCSTGYDNSKSVEFAKNIEKEIEKSRNPFAQIPKIRKYAVEKLNDISDAEINVVNSQKPKINSNYENTEYSFVWTLKKHYMIEVVTTPAPFEPIAVYRVKRVYYP